MAFFASFVQGVFQGMDWREGRDDRTRRRGIQDELLERDRERFGWEREDRTHTQGERAHTASERRRAIQEREADLAAWGETTDQMIEREERRGRGSREISILPPEPNRSVPENRANSRDAGLVSASPTPSQISDPATAQRSLGVTGASTGEAQQRPVSDLSKRGGANPRRSPVPEALLSDGTFMGFANNAGARPDEFWNSLDEGQRQQFVQRASQPQSVRGPLHGVTDPGADPATAANPSYREPTSERPEPPQAGPRPGRTMGLPLDGVVLPPEQHSTPQQGGRVRHQQPVQAPAPPQPTDPAAVRAGTPPAQPGRPAYAAADWEPTPLSSTGTPLAEVSLPGDQPPPPDAARQRADQLAGALPAAGRGIMDGVRRVGGRIADDLAYSRDVGGAVVERGLGTGLSVMGAPEAGAEAFRRGDDATQRVRDNEARVAASRSVGVPPEGAPPPQAGAKPAQGQQPAGQPGRQGVPTTPRGTPIASLESVQRSTPQAPATTSRSGATRQPSEAQREQAAERAVQDYRSRRMTPIVERYLRTGRPEQARAFEAWMNERGVQEGMRSWARAIHAYGTNDFEGLLEGLVGAYEANDYYDDGLSIDRSQTDVQRDERGNITGATIAFRDNATGRTFQQEINGIRDMAAVAIGTLSPEAVFERMWEQTFGRDADRDERAAARQRAYGQAYERLSRADLNWGSLSPSEQDARIQEHLQRSTGASGIGAGAVPVYSD
ncbi:hypothetical protein [Pararhodobacter sp.]|uniref:hypothetical protein n=1 Tax=Pararhodobacter sp. TaxID=2127056 RepID=UPI002FDD3ADE